MKKVILFLLCTLGVSALYAQDEGNPFARYGYKARGSTTIMGRSVLHDRQKIVAIGSVMFDTRADTIAGEFIPDSTIQQLEAQTVSMFISDIGRFNTPDPLAEKYYHISPYAYCLNNPINNIDPDGREVWSTSDPEEIKRLLADLNRIYSAKYGNEEDAFSYKSVEKERQVRTNPVDLFSPSTWFAKPEYKTETYTENILVANTSFDWSQDEYTRAMKEVLDDPFRIRLLIKNDGNLDMIKHYGGGKTDKNNMIELSSKLANFGEPGTVGANAHEWTYGGVFLHESIYHFHHRGIIEQNRKGVFEGKERVGPHYMRAYYRTRAWSYLKDHAAGGYSKIPSK